MQYRTALYMRLVSFPQNCIVPFIAYHTIILPYCALQTRPCAC
nr:MAG TPA: hypothetical protein [Caudoviricetes sp.]